MQTCRDFLGIEPCNRELGFRLVGNNEADGLKLSGFRVEANRIINISHIRIPGLGSNFHSSLMGFGLIGFRLLYWVYRVLGLWVLGLGWRLG